MAAPPRHDASGSRQEPLYDTSIPTPSHAERARTLVARGGDATLATVAGDGSPYASLVLFALLDATPVLLVSGLAAHTQNLKVDPRCSLLVREAGPESPLAIGRVSLMGRAEPTEGDTHDAARAAYLARHPDARFYADYGDFGFWRVHVATARWIGGFGRMSWVGEEDWHAATADPLDQAAPGIVAHMNADHVDAMRAYCAAFSKAGTVDEVQMTSVDRYGIELSARTDTGPRPVRVAFAEPVETAGEVRAELVRLVGVARDQLGWTGR